MFQVLALLAKLILVCKFCEQPIYETEQTLGYTGGPMVYMRGKYRHIEGDAWGCEISKINPSNPNYETPKCHICGTKDDTHGLVCSASGFPPYYAKLAGD